MSDTQELKFSDLALSPEVSKAIKSIGYETPSPIQAEAIPHFLEGRDILGVAQTGTGKTAAFALPVLSNLDPKQKDPQVLCLAPTRELAIQVAEAFQTYAQHIKGFKVLPVYGGTDYRAQIRQLERGVHVIVGTPGRVMDHMRKKTLKLDGMTTLILDEADEMLRMGFIDDVEWIMEQMPKNLKTALFSATMPPPIKKLTKKYLNDPAEITIKSKTTTAANIRQRYVQLKNNEKLDTLTRIMEVEEFDGIIIFVRTKNSTVEVSDRLQARGFASSALNGDIAQNQREKTVNSLKKGKIDIIVATDVAARGLDVERISHVINYDVPYDTESYVHRIGRTGRAGRTGDAILFVNGRERRMLQAIEKTTRKQIEQYKFPSIDVLNERKFEQLFTKIDNELKKDLGEYTSVIEKYFSHNEVDPVKLAAALASLEAGGKPFYVTESFVKTSTGRFESDSNDRGGDRGRDRGKRSDRGERGSGGSRTVANVKTYRIEVGESHGAEKRDIVGAIANEAGIESKFMGKIYINDDFSTIELPNNLSKDAIADLKKVKVRGQNLRIKEAEGDDVQQEERKPRRRKPTSESRRSNSGEKRGDKRGSEKKNGDKRTSEKRKPKNKSNDADSANEHKEKAPKKAKKKTKTKASIQKGLEKKARKKLERSNAKAKASE